MHVSQSRSSRQGASSTIRCIKTCRPGSLSPRCCSRGVSSTIRCIKTGQSLCGLWTRLPSQGAPGTIRCIETRWSRTPPDLRDTRQGTPSTIRRIETRGTLHRQRLRTASGSAQHCQVHLCPCPRRAGRGPLPKCQGGRGRPTPWWCRVRMRHQHFSGLLLLGSAHTRGSN